MKLVLPPAAGVCLSCQVPPGVEPTTFCPTLPINDGWSDDQQPCFNTSTRHDVVMTTSQTVGAPTSADRHTPREQERFSFPSAPSRHMTLPPMSVCACVFVCLSAVLTVSAAADTRPSLW